MCMGKDLLLVNIQQCQKLSFHFQATGERPLITEYCCQNCKLGDVGGTDTVKDNNIVLLSLTGNTQLLFKPERPWCHH